MATSWQQAGWCTCADAASKSVALEVKLPQRWHEAKEVIVRLARYAIKAEVNHCQLKHSCPGGW